MARVRRSIACLLAIMLARGAVGAPAERDLHLERVTGVPVAAAGVTHFHAGAATAVLTTRRAAPEENTPGHVTACTGGRLPCALVDRLAINVAGREVEVPSRVLPMISDVNRGKLFLLPNNRYELDLDGGDASVGYEARIFFDRRMVRRVDIWAGEAHMLEQRTDFHDLSHAFN